MSLRLWHHRFGVAAVQGVVSLCWTARTTTLRVLWLWCKRPTLPVQSRALPSAVMMLGLMRLTLCMRLKLALTQLRRLVLLSLATPPSLQSLQHQCPGDASVVSNVGGRRQLGRARRKVANKVVASALAPVPRRACSIWRLSCPATIRYVVRCQPHVDCVSRSFVFLFACLLVRQGDDEGDDDDDDLDGFIDDRTQVSVEGASQDTDGGAQLQGSQQRRMYTTSMLSPDENPSQVHR